MSTVVITGVSSFVGCHLARHWAARGHRVIGTISRPRPQYAGIEAQRLATIEPFVTFERLELHEPDRIPELVDRVAPDVCIHHAGYATNYAASDYDLDAGHAINVAPLPALFAALAGTRCGVILTGSSAEYSAADRGNREDDPCCPESPYGLSKLTATLRAKQLAQRWSVPTRVARLYIPFGALDHPQKLLAQTVSSLRAGRSIALSPCEQKRDFVGVADVCDAYERLVSDLPRTGFDIFNIGCGEGVVLRDLLIRIADRLGAPRDLLRFGERPMRPGEPAVSYADIGKARRVLGWSPTELDRAIERDLIGEAETVGSA